MVGRAHGYDVVVVGGGVIGVACAWRLAQRGLSVAMVDPAPGAGASYVAAGMLAPVTEAHFGEEPLLRLNLEAATGYPVFVDELEDISGRRVGYRRCGTLALALDASDRAALHEFVAFQRRLGLDVEVLAGRDCRRLEPLLAPAVQGGVLVSSDHQVDPRRLTAALAIAAARAGAVAVHDQVSAVTSRGDAATGVRLGDGTLLTAGTVVLAAGCRSGAIGGIPDDVRLPVRPVKGQVVRLAVPRACRPFVSRTVRGIVRGAAVYLVPREDGELVVGATEEEQGFDEQVTAGGIFQLLRDAHALLPGLTELPLVQTRAGLRPGTPDNAPIVGPTRMPGLVSATGHYRNGILLAAVTANAVVALVADGALPAVMEPFTPRRFGTPQQAQPVAEGAGR